jgi:hypothetical protein
MSQNNVLVLSLFLSFSLRSSFLSIQCGIMYKDYRQLAIPNLEIASLHDKRCRRRLEHGAAG